MINCIKSRYKKVLYSGKLVCWNVQIGQNCTQMCRWGEIWTKMLVAFHEEFLFFKKLQTDVELWRTKPKTGKRETERNQNWHMFPSLFTIWEWRERLAYQRGIGKGAAHLLPSFQQGRCYQLFLLPTYIPMRAQAGIRSDQPSVFQWCLARGHRGNPQVPDGATNPPWLGGSVRARRNLTRLRSCGRWPVPVGGCVCHARTLESLGVLPHWEPLSPTLWKGIAWPPCG